MHYLFGKFLKKEGIFKMIKILYVALVELDIMEGGSVHTKNIIKGLLEEDLEIKLACPSCKMPNEIDHSIYPLRFYGFSFLRLLLFNIVSIFSLFNINLKYKSDLYYLRDRLGNISPIILAILFRKKYIIEHNGYLAIDFQKGIWGYVIYRLRRFQFRYADGIVFNCPKLEEQYSQRFGISSEKTKVISMYLDTTIFKNEADEKIYSELNIDDQNVVLGYIGNSSYRHDIEIMLKTLRHLLENDIEAKALLISTRKPFDLTDFDDIKQHIIQLHNIPHNQVYRYINVFTVGFAVVNNATGNSPESFLKFKEYLSCGVPVIFNGQLKTPVNKYPKDAIFYIPSIPVTEITIPKMAEEIIKMANISLDSKDEISKFIKEAYSLKELALLNKQLFEDVVYS